MMINETAQQYKQLIKEELGIQDSTKINWMSQMAQIHAIKEGLQPNSVNASNGIYSTPLNTIGAGNVMMPQTLDNDGAGLAGGAFGNQIPGSGDIPMSTLSMALEIAAVTIGFDLVPVVPASGPFAMLVFNDFPYAGGKLGRAGLETAFDGKGPGDENKPIYIKVLTNAMTDDNVEKLREHSYREKLQMSVHHNNYCILGKYVGLSRIDSGIIMRVEDIQAPEGYEGAQISSSNYSIADVINMIKQNGGSIEVDQILEDGAELPVANIDIATTNTLSVDLVKGVTDHVQGFANFATGSEDPMSRAENETGTGNTIGARMFSKMVRMGAYEATGSVTRQQLQDMPLYGIDVVGGVLEACQNEISQHWNNRILDRLFKLGVENYEVQRRYQKADLNLYIGTANKVNKDLNAFSGWSKYVKLDNTQPASVKIPNATVNTSSAENLITHQRRIMSRCLAASNLISSVTRKGRAQWIVCNAQILSALQDCAQFVVAPMSNNLIQGGDESLYFAGTIAGMSVYVDPYMTWDDTRICVGRKASVSNNKVNGSGVVFMPYILADTVQVVAEGTMAPKILVNSRAAIVDAGFYPEQNYYTFMVETESGII